MTALRWTRRALDALLLAAVLTVAVTAGITLLAPALGGRALAIGGGSMEPAIGRGSLVLALPTSDGVYAVGDVVTVQHGASTPYTHRISRLAELKGVPHVETKGDANPQPDPAIIPTTDVVGRIAMSLPLLGYLSLILGTATGLAGFLALCATVLLLTWILEDLEEERCPVCAEAATPAAAATRAAATAGLLSALPAFAVPGKRTRVREAGRARDPRTPVLLEADRRDPRRREVRTTPDLSAARADLPATPPDLPATPPDLAPAPPVEGVRDARDPGTRDGNLAA
jgi:signal peptidase I